MSRRVALSPQEQRVLALVGKGYSTAEIAKRLGVSDGTAAQYVTRVITFVKARARQQAERPVDLTTRESEVLELLRLGASNAEIADRLSLGRRTAETHVAHVLRKLRIRSRRELRRGKGAAN